MPTPNTGDVVHLGAVPPTVMRRHPHATAWWAIERHDELLADGGQVAVDTVFLFNNDHQYGVEWTLDEAEQHLEEMLAAVRAARED